MPWPLGMDILTSRDASQCTLSDHLTGALILSLFLTVSMLSMSSSCPHQQSLKSAKQPNASSKSDARRHSREIRHDLRLHRYRRTDNLPDILRLVFESNADEPSITTTSNHVIEYENGCLIDVCFLPSGVHLVGHNSNARDSNTPGTLFGLWSHSIKVILDILVDSIAQLQMRQHAEGHSRSYQVKLTECKTILQISTALFLDQP